MFTGTAAHLKKKRKKRSGRTGKTGIGHMPTKIKEITSNGAVFKAVTFRVTSRLWHRASYRGKALLEQVE